MTDNDKKKRPADHLWLPKIESDPVFNPFSSVEASAAEPGSNSVCPSVPLAE